MAPATAERAESGQGQTGRPALIAFHAGLVMHGDAISNSVRLKLDAFEHWDPDAREVEVVAFAQATDGCDPRIVTCPSVATLLADARFRRAALHVFEFGIAYDLFDAALLLPGERLAAHYHNITPPQLIDDPIVRRRVEESQLQIHNVAHASRVLCDSAYNADDLIGRGFAPERLSVTPLPPAVHVRPRTRAPRERVEILYVGRFVAAKGIDVLLDAVSSLVGSGDAGAIRLTLAGNAALSGRAVLGALAEHGSPAVRIVESPDDQQLAQLYEDAEVFAIASRHEGYCVPALEALCAGCQVVATDAGALPELVGGLGQLVPVDDVAAFAAALARAVAAARAADEPDAEVPTSTGPLPREEWRARVLELAEARTARRCGQRMVDELLPLVRAEAVS